MNAQAIPIFVISLDRAADRRAAMARHLAELGLEFEITKAVDGRTLPEAEIEALTRPGHPFSPGVIGCYLSHMNVYRAMLDRRIPLAVVLEDDGVLNPALRSVLVSGIPDPEFDICFLDSWSIGHRGKVFYDRDDALVLSPHFTAYRLVPPPYGAHAYMITREAAARRLEHAVPMTESIDWYESAQPGMRFYGLVEPRGAWLNETLSTVSFTNPFGTRNAQPWHVRWRRWSPWYDFWNLAHPSMIKARLRIPALQAAGVLPRSGHWRPLPPTVVGGGPVRPRRAAANR